MDESKSNVFPFDPLPLTLRVEEVANILRISKVKAYELTKSPDFPCIRIGKRICIPRDNFLAWLNSNSFKKHD